MNDSIRYDAWLRLLDGGALSADDINSLGRALAEPQELPQLYEDRSLDRMLRLIGDSVGDRDNFVVDCVRRYEKIAGSEITPPDCTQVSVVRVAIQPTVLRRRVHRFRTFRKWALALLSASAVALIIFAAVVLNRSNDDPVVSKQPEQNTVAADGSSAEEVESEGQLPGLPRLTHDDTDTGVQKSEFAIDDPFGPMNSVESKLSSNELPAAAAVDHPIVKLAETFAEIRYGDDAVWRSDAPQSRLGRGWLDLQDGLAAVSFDDRATVVMQGPAAVKLNSPSSIQVMGGRILLQTRDGLDGEFEVDSRDASFSTQPDSQAMLYVDETGSEFLISRGTAFVRRSDPAEQRQPLELNETQLQHVFMNAADQQTPTITLAKGKEKYLAQMGFGETLREADSPSEFEQLFGQFAFSDEKIRSGPAAQLREVVRQFHQTMVPPFHLPFAGEEEAAAGKVTGENEIPQKNGFSFQGAININGVGVNFSSADDMHRWLQQFNRRFK
jgi:hypothetical protein